MKYMLYSLSITAVIFLFAACAQESGETAAASNELRHGADLGTNLVVSFYEALLQEEPPTREQELALFPALSPMRWKLVLSPFDPEDTKDYEPMTQTDQQRARRKAQEEKVAAAAAAAAAGPVVLTYFREHREWFVPKNMKSPTEIQISSTYHFIRNLERMKDPPKPGYGSVVALFVDDRQAPRMRLRAVLFSLTDGKIDPDAIWLDGYQGKMISELLQEAENEP